MAFISEDFQVAFLPFYRLVVQTSHAEDTVLVLDDRSDVVAYFRHAPEFPPAEVLKLFGLPFQDVQIFASSSESMLIPEEVFEEADQGLYSGFFECAPPQYEPQIERFEKLGAILISQPDQILTRRWKALFPNAVWHSSSFSLFRSAENFLALTGSVIHLRFWAGKLECIFVSESALQFHNTFMINTLSDIHYYLLSIYKQYNVQRADYMVILGAFPEKNWLPQLSLLAENMVFAEATEGIQFPAQLDQNSKMEISSVFVTCA